MAVRGPFATMPSLSREEPIVTHLISRLACGMACVAAALAIAACGGDGNDHSSAPTATKLALRGTSASTVSLAWDRDAQATGYSLERREGSGNFEAVAQLPSDVHRYLDEGLAPHTAYTYRLTTHRGSAGGSQDSAQGSATTTDDALELTSTGAVLGETGRALIGAAGGSVASADGSVRVDVPGSAWTADAVVVLQGQENTAPGGVGSALHLRLPAVPAKPLTLSLTYGEDAASDADGLGVALQRRDGSWLSLPVKALDRAARRIALELPVDALPRAVHAQALRAGASEAQGDVELTLTTVRLLSLAPRSARLPVGQAQRFVPYQRVVQTEEVGGDCPETLSLCPVPIPLVTQHQAPFLNSKPGYTRQWLVQGVEGGSSSLGTVQAEGDVGALYTAPGHAPTPNPVKVMFRSRHDQSGRSIELSADVTVVEPVWTGIVHGTLDGASDIGFSFSAEAVWTLDAASDDEFHASGTQSVHVIDITCSGSASPSTVPLPPGLLKIDRSTTPPHYTLDVGSLWNTTISGTCPGRGGTSVAMVVPGQLQAQGSVSADGTLIEGTAHLNNIQWDWSFTSQLQP